ncbi:CGNR zinc finger domain-containing protein [Saccharopolyspora sp. NPDC050389]|uniref:CGNR zinc finger domain-containing protein n=1 Tax=Saccharopolyspora sp. NPDC050389 TaxID=3155516 RepID=UPI0033D1CFA0
MRPDTSRNRYWCSMAGCGSRAKAKGHYDRVKSSLTRPEVAPPELWRCGSSAVVGGQAPACRLGEPGPGAAENAGCLRQASRRVPEVLP